MKITRLELAGFGPYKDVQRVDFEAFADDGIFLITGKTGAGKSSILDAICFALYDSVPRYEQTQKNLRSDYCAPDDPTYVELEFTVGDAAYRVRRTPAFERPKKRGEGMATAPATAELAKNVDGGWEVTAAKPVDVGKELAVIVGLTKDQFLQVILLAQNRFQDFLKAGNDERQEVLRTLFGTKRFADIELALIERRKVLEAELGEARAVIVQHARQLESLIERGDLPETPTLDWFDSGLSLAITAQELAQSDATAADGLFRAADASHRMLAQTRALQDRRERARVALAQLEGAAPAVDAQRIQLSAATRAASVWSYVVADNAAQKSLLAARADEAGARAEFAELSKTDPDQSEESLATAVDERTRSLGALAGALNDEAAIDRLARDVERAERDLERRTTDVASAQKLIDEMPALLADASIELAALRLAASKADAVREHEGRVTLALESAVAADALEADVAKASKAEVAASGALASAASELHELLEQRLNGYAGELAADLVEGEACAVCGSTSHPSPASGDAEPVTEERVDAARARVVSRQLLLDDAQGARERVVLALTAARARTNNRSVEQLEAELAEVTAELAVASEAHDTAEIMEAQAATLRANLESSTATLAGIVAERDAAALDLAAVRTTHSATVDRVAKERAGFDSVALRAESLQVVIDSARTLLSAVDATRLQSSAADSAAAALDAQLAEHDFADVTAVELARTDAGVIRDLESDIRRHDQAIATATATLEEAEVAATPDALVDLVESESALTLASAARDEAMLVQNSCDDRVKQVTRVVKDAKVVLAATGSRAIEFETLRELANVVAGAEPNTRRMRLETYVLAAQLEEIVLAANARLKTMTSGRYTLLHDDSLAFRNARSGLGLAILDQHTGRSRATHSLSGGETFLASLALALGLAEVVTNQAGGITLDTLFIDEGFGSLDGDTLDIAMSTLDSLRAGGRTIGLISHVDAMKEQIHANLRITVVDNGASAVESRVG